MRRPLLEASIGLTGGLLAASEIPDSAARISLVIGAALFACLAPAEFGRAPSGVRASVSVAPASATENGSLPPDHVGTLLGRSPVLVSLEGRVASAPEPGRAGQEAFDLDVATLGRRRRRAAQGTVRVLVPTGRALDPGDLVRVLGTAQPGRTPSNPGEPDHSASRRRRGRTHLLVVERAGNLSVLRPTGRLSPGRLVSRMRRAAAKRLSLALPAPDNALASGLLLGRRRGIPPETGEAFRRSGTAHLLAVSGLHVGLVTLGLLTILGALGLPDRVRIPIVLVMVTIYAGLAGLRPPVVRATLLAALYLGSRLLRRRTAALDLLGATAFVLLIPHPARAEEIGFQLSFTAVLGLILLTRQIAGALFPHRDIARRFAAWHRVPFWKRIPRDALHRMLPTATAAWLSTAPLVMFHFGVLTPGSVLANLVLVPLLLPALAASVVALALGAASPDVLALPLAALRHGAAGFAAVPGVCVDTPHPPLAAVLGIYGALLLLRLVRVWTRRHLLLATALPFVLFAFVLPRTPPETDRLTVLDVSQGSSVLLEQASGPVLLYDAGSMAPDVGARRIGPALRARRIRRLDALVLSHADTDHVNAAPYLLRRFRVGRLYVPEGFTDSPAGSRILGLASRHGVPATTVAAGDAIPPFGLVLHPPRGARLSDNDGSLVLRVRLGSSPVLLTGDLEADGCDMLQRCGRSLAADAVLLPHHGGRNPALGALLRAIDPSVLLVSAGRGFPTETTPSHLARHRTSDRGAITLRGGKDGLRVSGFIQSRQVREIRNR